MKKILLLVAMLSITLLSVGSAYAVDGTPDNVPGQDIVIPIICEDNHFVDTTLVADPTNPVTNYFSGNTGVTDGTLNTLWAIAEVTNSPTTAKAFIYNSKSEFVKDFDVKWTARDVINSDCQTVIGTLLSSSQQKKMAAEVSVNGNAMIVFAGYIIYQNGGYNVTIPFPISIAPADQLISWVYQVDMPNGFATGYDGYDVEGGVDLASNFASVPSNLLEDGTAIDVNVFMPRYFFLNTDPGTFNWWYILKGGPVVPSHRLNGSVCNEEEECESLLIPVPNNFNIIDVGDVINSSMFHDTVIEDGTLSAGETPKRGGGFGIFNTETGDSVAPCPIAGFHPVATVGSVSCTDDVSSLGWSYQRAVQSGPATNWDVIHPMHAILFVQEQTPGG